MKKILPHIHHWTTFHDEIGQDVHSYLVESSGVIFLIDPMIPAKGLDWFRKRAQPQHIYLTNRLHYRGSADFVEAFGATVWCHRAGLHEFAGGEKVRGFNHGEQLPGGILALKIGSLCPEETALYIQQDGGVVAIGDAVIREDDELDFVPDELMGEDAEKVKRGLRLSLSGLLDYEFDHLLFAHGSPWIGGAKDALRQFLKKRSERA